MKELEELKDIVDDFMKSANDFIEKVKENQRKMEAFNAELQEYEKQLTKKDCE